MTKSKDIKQQQADLLGMPAGTAEKHLRKEIIHELARQTGKNLCCRCGLEIQAPNDFAIIHVQDWEGNPDLFWDLTNIAFSHTSCEASRVGKRQEKPMNRIEVRVEDPNGNPLPGTRHNDELYVAGKKGQRYQIRVRNKTKQRLLIIPTVDGRNVITGKLGDHQDSGHVLDSFQSWTFTGWRTSDTEVAAFKFGKKGRAYSSEMGTPEHVGIIGIAVFEELVPEVIIKTVKEYVPVPMPYPVPTLPYRPLHPWIIPTPMWQTGPNTGTPATFSIVNVDEDDRGYLRGAGTTTTVLSCSTSTGPTVAAQSVSVSPVQHLGTEFGEPLASHVKHVQFKRASADPCEVFVIRYDSMDALRQQGIMVSPSERPQNRPQAFPQNPEVQGTYCQPPPSKRVHRG